MADDDVDLTALEIIRRYSLAVRQPAADRQDLLALLEADVAWLKSGTRPRPAATAPADTTSPTTKASPRARARKAPSR